MSNPALNDGIFKRETSAARGGSFTPGWGSPASEMPADLFGSQKSSGPVAGQDGAESPIGPGGDSMRLGGTLSAAGVLLAILIAAGGFGWQAVKVETALTVSGEVVVTSGLPGWIIPLMLGAVAVGILTAFKPKLARFTGPLYSVAIGVVAGAISKYYETAYDGIVLQAIGLTVGVFVMMLVLFATRTIRVTDKLRTGIFAATGAVALLYVVDLVLRMFGTGVPMIHESGAFGIIFSLVVVGIAAFNLLIDFDLVERGVQMRAPRYMEWYAAFGLIVTLVWLYLEILRLLAKLRDH